jgi:hypothetical protein
MVSKEKTSPHGGVFLCEEGFDDGNEQVKKRGQNRNSTPL